VHFVFGSAVVIDGDILRSSFDLCIWFLAMGLGSGLAEVAHVWGFFDLICGFWL